MVLDNTNGSPSLLASMSTAVELLECRIDSVAANRVRWWSCSVLVANVSYFSELISEMELLGSRRNMNLSKDYADAF
jgi:hypothetical protein